MDSWNNANSLFFGKKDCFLLPVAHIIQGLHFYSLVSGDSFVYGYAINFLVLGINLLYCLIFFIDVLIPMNFIHLLFFLESEGKT